jgi:hypothetical protein
MTVYTAPYLPCFLWLVSNFQQLIWSSTNTCPHTLYVPATDWNFFPYTKVHLETLSSKSNENNYILNSNASQSSSSYCTLLFDKSKCHKIYYKAEETQYLEALGYHNGFKSKLIM